MLRDVTAKNIAPNSQPLSDGGVSGLRLHPTKEKGRGLWKLRFISPSTGKRRELLEEPISAEYARLKDGSSDLVWLTQRLKAQVEILLDLCDRETV